MARAKNYLLNTAEKIAKYNPPEQPAIAETPEPEMQISFEDMKAAIMNRLTNWQRSQYSREVARRQRERKQPMMLGEMAQFLKLKKESPKHTEKPRMVDILINAYNQFHAKDERHPQVIMRELGITYETAEPQPIADQWVFYNCKNVPAELPSFVKTLERNSKNEG